MKHYVVHVRGWVIPNANVPIDIEFHVRGWVISNQIVPTLQLLLHKKSFD